MQPGKRQHILEILQMRHERMQVALQRGFLTLGQSEQIMPARPGRGFPILRQDRITTGAGVKSTMLPPRIDT